MLSTLTNFTFLDWATVVVCTWLGVAAWRHILSPRARWYVLEDKPLLTPNEREFFGRLRRALPDVDIFPQVAMSALIDTSTDSNHPYFWRIRSRFDRKVVDFVLCDRKSHRVLGVIELDDRTHDTKKGADAIRDEMLASVGIPTARFDSRAKPAVSDLARLIRQQGIHLAQG